MSISTFALEATTLQALKCKSCANHLSVPPIKIVSGDHFCGRCNIEGMRATAYETLAKRARFPCKNEGLGCSAPLTFEGVLAHENVCQFNPLECPLCNQTFPRRNMSHHLQTLHADLLVIGGVSLPPNQDSVNCKRLLVVGQETYILCIRKYPKGNFFIVLTSIGPKQIEYSLVIRSETNKLVIGGQKVIPYNSFDEYASDEKNVQIEQHIKSVLKSENFSFDVEIAGKMSEKDLKLIEEIECIVCKDYMKPPVFICEMGHSLCGTCKSKIAKCPLCDSFLDEGRNYVLEKLLERVAYPCQNHPECNFSGSLEAIKDHEMGCLQKIQCPFTPSRCNWWSTTCNVTAHLTETHQASVLPLNAEMSVDSNLGRVAGFVIQFDNNHFVLKIIPRLVLDDVYVFFMKHLEKKPRRGPAYNFVIEFLDQGGKGRRHTMENPCDDKLYLYKRSLEPFIAADTKKLCFKINMERVR